MKENRGGAAANGPGLLFCLLCLIPVVGEMKIPRPMKPGGGLNLPRYGKA